MRRRESGFAASLAGSIFILGLVSSAAMIDAKPVRGQNLSWVSRIERIDEHLHQEEWTKARRANDRLLHDLLEQLAVRGSDLIGRALVQRAILSEAEGRRDEALWDVFAADALSRWTRTFLPGYGPRGAALLEALTEEPAEEPERPELDIVVESGRGLLALASSEDSSALSADDASAGEVTPPQRTSTAAPEFPLAFRGAHQDQRAGLHESVVVKVVLDENGLPTKPRILKGGAYPVLLLSALEAMKEWRFEPALKDGQPVEVYYHLAINFRLR